MVLWTVIRMGEWEGRAFYLCYQRRQEGSLELPMLHPCLQGKIVSTRRQNPIPRRETQSYQHRVISNNSHDFDGSALQQILLLLRVWDGILPFTTQKSLLQRSENQNEGFLWMWTECALNDKANGTEQNTHSLEALTNQQMSLRTESRFQAKWSSLVAQWDKDLALSLLWPRSLLWHGFDTWPRKFCMHRAWPKNPNK